MWSISKAYLSWIFDLCNVFAYHLFLFPGRNACIVQADTLSIKQIFSHKGTMTKDYILQTPANSSSLIQYWVKLPKICASNIRPEAPKVEMDPKISYHIPMSFRLPLVNIFQKCPILSYLVIHFWFDITHFVEVAVKILSQIMRLIIFPKIVCCFSFRHLKT